ncbi:MULTISPECIES: hypothetical protein [Stenotrophomonas]|jgi:hypothetical protein|uniref:DUF4440 domain-containing protein n=1 Tax=Stenotrophomonas pavanii TaxID=487698 RepID=A0ABN6GM44_9GAMM|nr:MULTISPECIES: hypothetical protein [Stenotrophomonas]MBC9080018.1 hypothetical protein [Stenotrophomonas maltophilia]MBC9094003.1 hypothetical protein [Stenotrophomonas maltophilia]MBH1390395.1 hypothetical protein [Stenotrophomonas maltophilia]MBH1522469.1 hypothetical protein [Stenotrophomonas maltophilia]MCF3466046.1 hypothetical protein [Stenotrophomonas maltophilia]
MRRMAYLIPALLLAACSQPEPPAQPAVDAPPPMEANAAATPAAEPAAPAAEPAAAPAALTAPAAEASAEDARARIESLLGDAAQFEKVFNAFKAAVVGGDRAAVVEEVRFPLNISGGKKISGPGEFQRNYEKIITPEVVKAVSEQDFGKVFVNQQGVMIGSGQVWLSGQCLDQACTKTEVKVITIQ